MKKFTETVFGIQEPTSVKEYLLRLGFSNTLIKRVKFGGIFLDGRGVTVKDPVKDGMRLEVALPRDRSENIEPMDIPIKIVYEDEHILVVDKPKNMPTHPSKGNRLPTLANAIMGMYGGNFVFRAINRLDRDTSGLVLIAKNQISAYNLSESMKAGRFKKEYICTVSGIPSPLSGIIDAPIRREAEGSVKRTVA